MIHGVFCFLAHCVELSYDGGDAYADDPPDTTAIGSDAWFEASIFAKGSRPTL
ncbi:MAG TPA: hypothetical protein VEI24_06510 [Nitrospiria bacterium]|nr:hypothetical protein [Nitrospiria bacterium]